MTAPLRCQRRRHILLPRTDRGAPMLPAVLLEQREQIQADVQHALCVTGFTLLVLFLKIKSQYHKMLGSVLMDFSSFFFCRSILQKENEHQHSGGFVCS